MTTNEERAREWLDSLYHTPTQTLVESLAALLAEVERETREACAKVAEDYLSDRKYDIGDEIAAAIRAREARP